MKKNYFLTFALALLTVLSSQAAAIDDELSAIDLSQISTVIGEGENLAPVVLRFNYPYAVDNVVIGYRYNGTSLNAVSALQEIASADSRITFASIGQMRYTLGMDLNGDGIINESDNLFTTGSDGRWTFTTGTIAGTTGILASFDRSGDQVKSPIFYLPAPETKGVWLPESLTVPLADENLCVVAYVQTTSDQIRTQTWRRSSSDQTYANDATILSSASASNLRLYSMSGQFKGNQGTTYLQFRPQFVTSGYMESNWCALTVTAPEIPITSLSWADDNLDCRLSHAVDNSLVYEPANATFTMISLKSSDTKVATASGTKPSAAKVTTTATAGEATITATYAADTELTAEFSLTSSLAYPVESITFDGVEADGKIHLNPKEMAGLIPIFSPIDPDIQTVNLTLDGGGTSKDEMIASMYKVNYWDENNTRIQFYELSGHRVGECTLTVTSGDGNFEHTYPVIVEEPDRTPLPDGYVDGTIILNEEWFGHTNGGLNYITPEGELMYQVYERENPGMSFGATSQYATIWADKLIACSKQAVDGGDPLPGGGRIVVADAKTLKRIGSIDNLAWDDETGSADARACAGATPSKMYVGSTKGVYVVDIDNIAITGKIGSIENDGTDLYNGQMGDMVNACGYVFAIKQAAGVYVIDTKTDKVAKYISAPSVQGITRTADGHVWYVTTVDDCSNFVELNPITLEEVSRFILPNDYGTVACSWGAWRNTQFVGCKSKNVIWFATGAQGIAGGGDGVYYSFDTETKAVKLVADIRGFEGSNSRVTQKNYGTLRYDDRSGELIVMTVDNSSSGHYRYNWYHFFDPETATLKRTIEPRPYYWFQCFAIFPDKYDPEFTEEAESLIVSNDSESVSIKISDLVSDKDHPSAWFNADVTVESQKPFEGTSDVADVSVADGNIVIDPISNGVMTLSANVESNGKVAAKSIPVVIGDVNLTDGMAYTFDEDLSDVNINYTRIFAHNDWQALYVPFTMDYAEWSDKVDVAEFTGVSAADGKLMLDFTTLSSGSLNPHTPYIVKPKEAGKVVLSASNASLSSVPATNGTINHTVEGISYTLTGVYAPTSGLTGCYALKGGVFMKGTSDEVVLSPYRIYLEIKASGAMRLPSAYAVRVDDEVTNSLDDLFIVTDENECYDLLGRKVDTPTSGLYIKNGQKVIVK